MKKLDKNKILAAFITFATIIVLGGITFTFFSASVSNANNEKINTQTATMSLEFDDNDNGVSGTLNLGESVVKRFTLENTGTVDAYGKINWYNLVNTYLPGSLTWTLEQSTSSNGTYTTVGSGSVPTSATATTATLRDGLMVPVNTTYYYKLTITLNNLDIDQSSDINAHMNSKFSLAAGKKLGTDTIMELVAGEPTNTTSVITKQAPAGATCTNTLAYDGTTDNNLRYVGANPCNYVTFNGESPNTGTKWAIVQLSDGAIMEVFDTQSECQSFFVEVGSPEEYECQSKTLTTGGWRIIGVMNNVDDGTGNQETRLKLIRNDSLGDYAWDTSYSNVNGGRGTNGWSQADLMYELNGDYLDTTLAANTYWYDNAQNSQAGIFDYTKGLNASAQSLIGNAKWYLGGASNDMAYNTEGEGTAAKFYGYERGTLTWGSTSGQACYDPACPRTTSWTGKVALAYPSDFGFAVGETVRSTCLGKKLYDYEEYNCKSNQWFFLNGGGWLLSPNSDYSYNVFNIIYYGLSDCPAATGNIFVKPVVYLKSDVSISGGNGTESEPFQIG